MPLYLHFLLKGAADRLGLKRGDVVCELVKQYAETLQLSDLTKKQRPGRGAETFGPTQDQFKLN